MRTLQMTREGMGLRVDAIIDYLDAGSIKDSTERALILELRTLIHGERFWQLHDAPPPLEEHTVRVRGVSTSLSPKEARS